MADTAPTRQPSSGTEVVEAATAAAAAADQKILDQKKAKVDAEYRKAAKAAAGTSKVTKAKKVREAKVIKKRAMGDVEKLKKKMEAAKQARIVAFMADAKQDRLLAIEAEAKLIARAAGYAWKEKAKASMAKRVYDGHALPQSAKECNAIYKAYPAASPYEAAYLFLVTWYRMRFVTGGKSRTISMALLMKVLHPDCLMEKDGTLKVRKHTLQGIRKSGLENVISSYFKGKDPAVKHPLNEYKVDEANMSVKFQPGEASYENEDGKTFKVEVYSHGCKKAVPPYRVIEMKYDASAADGGRWKAVEVSRLFQQVVPPFNLAGAETKEDLAREREYRAAYGLMPAVMAPLKAGAAGADYVVPTADYSMEKVDVIGTQMAHKKEEWQKKLDALPEEERAKKIAGIKHKKQVKAKAEFEAFAAKRAESAAEAEAAAKAATAKK